MRPIRGCDWGDPGLGDPALCWGDSPLGPRGFPLTHLPLLSPGLLVGSVSPLRKYLLLYIKYLLLLLLLLLEPSPSLLLTPLPRLPRAIR